MSLRSQPSPRARKQQENPRGRLYLGRWSCSRWWGGLGTLSSSYKPRKQVVETQHLPGGQKPGRLFKTLTADIKFQCRSRSRKTPCFSFLFPPQLLSAHSRECFKLPRDNLKQKITKVAHHVRSKRCLCSKLNCGKSFLLQVTSWSQHNEGGWGSEERQGIRQLHSGCVTPLKLLSFSGFQFPLLYSNSICSFQLCSLEPQWRGQETGCPGCQASPSATALPLHPKCGFSGLHKCPHEAAQLKRIFKPLDSTASEVCSSPETL